MGVDHARIGVQSADQLVPQPPCPHCQQTLPRGYFLQQSLLISSQQIAQRISEVKKEITQAVASLDMNASIPQANACRESLNPFDFLPMVTDAFVRSSEALSEDDAFASLVSPPAPVRLPEIASMNANGISLSSLLTDLRPAFAVDGSGDMREDSTKPLQDCGSVALQPETQVGSCSLNFAGKHIMMKYTVIFGDEIQSYSVHMSRARVLLLQFFFSFKHLTSCAHIYLIQEAVGGPSACPWQKLARISPR